MANSRTPSGITAPASSAPRGSAGVVGPTPFEAEIVAVFSDLVVLLGLPKSLGEIYGLVFASAEPTTFADIEHKLGLSKGSVSQGLRALRELGAVREAGATDGGMRDEGGNLKPEDPTTPQASTLRSQLSGLRSPPSSAPKVSGLSLQVSSASTAASSRATRWVATTELRQLIGNLLRERLTPYLERQDQRMEQAEIALRAEADLISAKDYKALKNRLTKLQTWQSRARTVLPVLGKML